MDTQPGSGSGQGDAGRAGPGTGMGAPFTVAVRGTGSIGSRHLRVLRDLGVRDLVAWPVRPRAVAGPTLGDADLVASATALADRRPDLVVVATDTARHVDDTLEVLSGLPAGSRVLLEKPVSHTLADGLRLAGTGDRVNVAAPLRFHAGLGRARDLLAEIGPVTWARIECSTWLPDWRPDRDYRDSYSARPDEGGALRDLVHEIDYACWVLGRPTSLQARLTNTGLLGIEAEEAADVLWTADGGAQVSLRLDYTGRPSRRRLFVQGAGGSVEWDALTARVELRRADGSREVSEHPADLDRDVVLARQSAEALWLVGRPTADSTQLATLADGLTVMAIVEAAHRSSREHREVAVPAVE